MPPLLKKVIAWALILGVFVALVWFIVSLLFPGTTPSPIQVATNLFGTSKSISLGNGGNGSGISSTTNIIQSGTYAGQQIPSQKIFKIADGPITGATFVQTTNPTTTLARYIAANDGHVFDLPLEVPGALARVVSGTTVPGLATALWAGQGSGAVVQYLEGSVVKTLFMGFPTASSTLASGQTPPRIHFLPGGITSVAVSPDGVSVAYLLKEGAGSSGYITNIATFNDKKLFSLPLTELILSWPTQNVLVAESKSATGVPGIAFSVSAKTGGTSLLVSALGLSATANSTFSKIVYQKADGSALPQSFVHDVASGRDATLPFNPSPERCVWSPLSQTSVVCAAPLASTPANYLDLWHQGLAHSADGIFSFDVQAGITSLLALPGSGQGGERADVAQVALSPDGKYLLYITRGDRSLWGVRLEQ